MTLDSVIGQAFEEWSVGRSPAAVPCASPSPLGAVQPPPAAEASQRQLLQQQVSATADAWQDSFETGAPAVKENVRPQRPGGGGQHSKAAALDRPGTGRQTQVTSFMSKINAASEGEVQEWRRRAQQLAAELQRIKEQQQEYARIKEAYERLQTEQVEAAKTYGAAKQEAAPELIKTGADPATVPAADPCLVDPLAAAQVTAQMEALLAEKARLAQENARLLRENTGLQVCGLLGGQG